MSRKHQTQMGSCWRDCFSQTFIYMWTHVNTHTHKLSHILRLIHQCMHTYAAISVVHLLGPLSFDIQYDLVLQKCTSVHEHGSPPFCNPYRLLCNPSVFLLIMSVLHSLSPACIDWSCPMHPALYLCSHNPQAGQAKIIVPPQRTHKSHIHCVLEKEFQNGHRCWSQETG